MGFKKTSETIAVSFGVSESAPNTFTQEQVALQLDVLNNEIFVVVAADLNLQAPELVPGTTTECRGAITSTSQTAIATLANTNTIAEAQLSIVSAGGEAVSFQRAAEESYQGDVDYIALIATNDFFVGLTGVGNVGSMSLSGRVFGFRARADSSTYAALVQSEVLSA